MKKPISRSPNQLNILEAVKTPLGYFVLTLLILEGAFGLISIRNSNPTLLLGLNLGAVVFVAAIVGLLAYLGVFDDNKNKSLPHYSIFVEAPDDLPGLDINRIIWDEQNCVMRIMNKTILFTPTSPSDTQGAALEVRITSDIFPTDENAPIDLTLTDQFGNRWDVRRFRLWQRNLKLRTRSDKNKIIQDYPEEGNQ